MTQRKNQIKSVHRLKSLAEKNQPLGCGNRRSSAKDGRRGRQSAIGAPRSVFFRPFVVLSSSFRRPFVVLSSSFRRPFVALSPFRPFAIDARRRKNTRSPSLFPSVTNAKHSISLAASCPPWQLPKICSCCSPRLEHLRPDFPLMEPWNHGTMEQPGCSPSSKAAV